MKIVHQFSTGFLLLAIFSLLDQNQQGLKVYGFVLRSLRGDYSQRHVYSNSQDGPIAEERGWEDKTATLVLGKDAVKSSSTQSSSKSLTPFQILYPAYFRTRDSIDHNDDSMTVELDRRLSLAATLKLFQKALERIRTINHEELQSLFPNIDRTKILRIEQVVEERRFDPLAWLHYQAKFPLRRKRNRGGAQLSPDHQSLFYFANQEGEFEVSCVGSVLTLSESSKIWDSWDDLPPRSRWYGGQRFDHVSKSYADSGAFGGHASTHSDEWAAFTAGNKALWILPALELKSVRYNGSTVVTAAIHLVADARQTDNIWARPAGALLDGIMSRITAQSSTRKPPTTLPPVMSRNFNYDGQDGQEMYENAVARAIEEFERDGIQKVVLARKQTLQYNHGASFTALDILRRWKYGGHEGGHLFLIRSGAAGSEFFGCTPERLFSVSHRKVQSEALAGTRPRGATQDADTALLRELFSSRKDWRENILTAKYIEEAFDELSKRGLATSREREADEEGKEKVSEATGFFVRRLLHLQHLCRRYAAELIGNDTAKDVTRYLFTQLHPTPAVCGFPFKESFDFIQQHESIGFDRGFYAGPVGHIGRDDSDIVVAIRSGLLTQSMDSKSDKKLEVYSGSGIVPGSTLKGEWTETNQKFAVISSIFPQSPFTLQGSVTPNMAWVTAFIEELLRNGVTQFYVCPGSRSTPLVVAIARAARSNPGVVQAVSVHDERAAGFRAVGYAKGSGRPAAVVTSSGTAVANLYPAVVEASMDGCPLLLLTADRPFENRESGANQAIDQVKLFSSTYVRWFRDVAPPSDDIPVSVALSDAGHAVNLSRRLRGPVHLNVQFRENLAPEGGRIRNDRRVDSMTKFESYRFTDVAGFARWSRNGGRWATFYSGVQSTASDAVHVVADLIADSKRGIIVVGSLRPSSAKGASTHQAGVEQAISDLAQFIGYPVFAGTQSAGLRFNSAAVVPFAELMLKCANVSKNINPDLIIQIGAPLVSTEVPNVVASSTKGSDEVHHVLIHPLAPHERADPDFTTTHVISTEISPFLTALQDVLEKRDVVHGSGLAPLVMLGKKLQSEMKSIIHEASDSATARNSSDCLTEPQLSLALSEFFCSDKYGERALFISNSMPVRDAEFFFYPYDKWDEGCRGPCSTGTNRGASGIDGIVSSCTGFVESTKIPSTLLIGDLACLHDINALHSISSASYMTQTVLDEADVANKRRKPLTIVVVNNDGGGIFSFLPIAGHEADASFEQFFGTPTRSFSFLNGAKAFGLACQQASSYFSFCQSYEEAVRRNSDSLVEALVVPRHVNVKVHRGITERVNSFLDVFLSRTKADGSSDRLPIKIYGDLNDDKADQESDEQRRVLMLLHGWMGDKSEWDNTANKLVKRLGSEWRIISVDLPGHGKAALYRSSEREIIRNCIHVDGDGIDTGLCLDEIARVVLNSLAMHGVEKIDTLAGYSLGGRVALAMNRLCQQEEFSTLVDARTSLVLLSADPGSLERTMNDMLCEKSAATPTRVTKDEILAAEIESLWSKACLTNGEKHIWDEFLRKWYRNPIWGKLDQDRARFSDLLARRSRALSCRGKDIAEVLRQCSPPRTVNDSWRFCSPNSTMFVAGSFDGKYSNIGKAWSQMSGIHYAEIDDVGHALLVEAPSVVSTLIADFVQREGGGAELSADGSARARSFAPTNEPCSDATTDGPTVPAGVPLHHFKSLRENPMLPREVGGSVRETSGSLEFEAFSIDPVGSSKGNVVGLGWGSKATSKNKVRSRSGFIVQLGLTSGMEVGLGEVSPLSGLHAESLEQAEEQLKVLQSLLVSEDGKQLREVDFERILDLDGWLETFLRQMCVAAGVETLYPSVRSGLEMALLSLASNKIGQPIHLFLGRAVKVPATTHALLPVNGLIPRSDFDGRIPRTQLDPDSRSFPSWKVKVGNQDMAQDTASMLRGFLLGELDRERKRGMVRADANRAWNYSQAIEFASALDGLDVHALERVEFIEEPLAKVVDELGKFSFIRQIDALEKLYMRTAIPYALDESINDLVQECNRNLTLMKEKLTVFKDSDCGCAAFVLKPALLGLELSLQIAQFARCELGISAVFSSSFDSGLALAYTALLGEAADRTGPPSVRCYPHGVGTFAMLKADTLDPSFETYVDEQGYLNIPALSRALYGLNLDEVRCSMPSSGETRSISSHEIQQSDIDDDSFEASTGASRSGEEISVAVSLPLPFSADIASSRFTDLPQQSRWSPWISSVSYKGQETEWELNVRGVSIRWRATSNLLVGPVPGIEWQSVSGVKNSGIVEFVPETSSSCTMKVRMTMMTPRILRPLFRGTSILVEDFLRNKLLKWSLETFRDVVVADLAIETGEVKIGDALVESVPQDEEDEGEK